MEEKEIVIGSEDPEEFLDAIDYYQGKVKELKLALDLREAQISTLIEYQCDRLKELVPNCQVKAVRWSQGATMTFTRGDASVCVEVGFASFNMKTAFGAVMWPIYQETLVADHIGAVLDKQ